MDIENSNCDNQRLRASASGVVANDISFSGSILGGGLTPSHPLRVILDNLNYQISLPSNIIHLIFYDFKGEMSYDIYKDIARRAFMLGVDTDSFLKIGYKCIAAECDPTSAVTYQEMFKDFVETYYLKDKPKYISFKNFISFISIKEGIRNLPTIIGLFLYMNHRLGITEIPISCNQIAKAFHVNGNDGEDSSKGNSNVNFLLKTYLKIGLIEMVTKGKPRSYGEKSVASKYKLSDIAFQAFDSLFGLQMDNYLLFNNEDSSTFWVEDNLRGY